MFCSFAEMTYLCTRNRRQTESNEASFNCRGANEEDTVKSPDGGIGRRAGLKHQWGNPCRFDPGSGYFSRSVLDIPTHFFFIFVPQFRRKVLLLQEIQSRLKTLWLKKH